MPDKYLGISAWCSPGHGFTVQCHGFVLKRFLLSGQFRSDIVLYSVDFVIGKNYTVVATVHLKVGLLKVLTERNFFPSMVCL